MTRVAVCSRSFSRHPILRRELLDRYPDVTFNDDGLALKGDSLVDFLSGHDKAITALEKITDDVLSRLPDLKAIGKFGVGLDMIDLDAMRRRGVRLGWRGGVNRRSVSELAIAMMLQYLRNLPDCDALTRGGDWRVIKGRQLSDRTVGVIGCGNVGKDLAVLLRAFGCRVLSHDILDFPEFYAQTGVEPVDLDTLLTTCDIVSIHLPLDDGTRGLMSAERLALLRDDALLVNLARGGIVDEAALKTLLAEKRLGGAAFDVYAEEPPTDLELLRLPTMFSTPHIGGSTEEGILAMGRAAIDGLDDNRVP